MNCFGDWLFWSGDADNYRGRREAWGEYLEAYLDRETVTDIVLFGDTFNRYFEAGNLDAAQRVLTAAGYRGAAIVKGDARVAAIAAASIVAKVTRDRMMARAGLSFPAYGFDSHAGYGTERHRTAIAIHGPCLLHRMSFRPLRSDGEEMCE